MKKTVFTFLSGLRVLLASEPSLMEKLDQLSIGRFTNKSCQVFEPIDFLYLINLDKRKEKWELSTRQLLPLGLKPFRFSGIDAIQLSIEELNEFGILFTKDSRKQINCGNFTAPDGLFKEKIADTIGQKYFSKIITRGTIGCTISHLCIWLDALKSNYDMVWVMEDDIHIKQNPLILKELIRELDQATNNDWDILFTNPGIRNIENKIVLHKGFDHSHFNMNVRDWKNVYSLNITKNLTKNEARFGTCSYIVKKSGLVKLLDYYMKHNMFVPIDWELTYVSKCNGLKIFETQAEIVTNLSNAISDNF